MGGDHRTRSSSSGRPAGAAAVPTTSAGLSSPDYVVDLFESLPRRGLDSRVWTVQALCEHLPPGPRIVAPGCGSGVRTVDLAELSAGAVLAVDPHVHPSVRPSRHERRHRACPTGCGASLPTRRRRAPGPERLTRCGPRAPSTTSGWTGPWCGAAGCSARDDTWDEQSRCGACRTSRKRCRRLPPVALGRPLGLRRPRNALGPALRRALGHCTLPDTARCGGTSCTPRWPHGSPNSAGTTDRRPTPCRCSTRSGRRSRCPASTRTAPPTSSPRLGPGAETGPLPTRVGQVGVRRVRRPARAPCPLRCVRPGLGPGRCACPGGRGGLTHGPAGDRNIRSTDRAPGIPPPVASVRSRRGQRR